MFRSADESRWPLIAFVTLVLVVFAAAPGAGRCAPAADEPAGKLPSGEPPSGEPPSGEPAPGGPTQPGTAAPVSYLLDVSLNHWPLGLVAHFTEENGRLWLPADEFEGLGFKLAPGIVTAVGETRRVYLDHVPGLTWRVDMPNQAIDIEAPFAMLKPTTLSIAPGVPRVPAISGWGGMFTYDAFAEWALKKDDAFFSRSISTNLEARVFSPWFTASTTGIASYADGGVGRFVRLDSTLTFDDPDKVWRLTLGDAISTGPEWMRAFRFGGVQWSTDFGLRPDLITIPLPTLSRNVAVPSTIDVLLNNVQRFSTNVDPGVFRLQDLPVAVGTNTISVVVTDQAGRRSTLVLPLYNSPDLLAKGLNDFGFAAGLSRQDYSQESNNYQGGFLSGYVSHGVTDRLTATASASLAKGYAGADLGAALNLGNFAVVEGVARFSSSPAGQGWDGYVTLERVTQNYDFSVRYEAADPNYRDLPAIFGDVHLKQQLSASAGVNLGDLGHVNVIYVLQQPAGEPFIGTATAGYSVDLFHHRVSLGASAYVNNGGSHDWGASLSLNFQLGNWGRGYVERSVDPSGHSQLYQLHGEAFEQRLDWELEGVTGAFPGAYGSADWEGQHADLNFRVVNAGASNALQFEIAQSFVALDNALFVASRVDDAFAVVEVGGIPGVRVALENQVVGKTDANGRIFVNELQSYAPNAISIVPTDLPVDATISKTAMLVAPRFGSGTVARFDVKQARSAVIVLRLPDGQPPPVGAAAELEGSNEPAITGFDGETFVVGLKAGRNRITVSWEGGHCSATFDAEAKAGALPRLGPFTCAP